MPHLHCDYFDLSRYMRFMQVLGKKIVYLIVVINLYPEKLK